eukprot:CAMPEP_0168300772 /NCGR_PEP_ID=MMETSP0142_2-20121227/32082_1 /TAXON_ID=44445 /ORGANISM="Pseudo-nitzschia australis, Strain 10249 10 AB" /LENGTH=101 /DNA_ID=CAMNT_0008250847 /DNA_START=1770 /DNA_END=2075 /DNA_ORIENTATION=+
MSAANKVMRLGLYLYSLRTHGRIQTDGMAFVVAVALPFSTLARSANDNDNGDNDDEDDGDDHGSLTPNMSGSQAKNMTNRSTVVHIISKTKIQRYPNTKEE